MRNHHELNQAASEFREVMRSHFKRPMTKNDAWPEDLRALAGPLIAKIDGLIHTAVLKHGGRDAESPADFDDMLSSARDHALYCAWHWQAEKTNFATFTFIAARNAVITYRRSKGRRDKRRQPFDFDLSTSIEPETLDTLPSLQRLTRQHPDLGEIVRRKLGFRGREQTYAEIAQAIGVSRYSVFVRYHKAIHLLREDMVEVA